MLDQKLRAAILALREKGRSRRSIAKALEISVKTVETQMGRALKKLRDAVAPHLG
jgi:RNA polymerase sigma-70 factor (ECF subfamily)